MVHKKWSFKRSGLSSGAMKQALVPRYIGLSREVVSGQGGLSREGLLYQQKMVVLVVTQIVQTGYMFPISGSLSKTSRKILPRHFKIWQVGKKSVPNPCQLFELARIFLILQDSCSKSMRKSCIA